MTKNEQILMEIISSLKEISLDVPKSTKEKINSNILDLKIVIGRLSNPYSKCACCGKDINMDNCREIAYIPVELICDDCADNLDFEEE